MADQPSMQDVATAAGVALGTVSNVLNHPHRVAESTRLRVQQTIAELGFVRNANARSLAGGSTDSIALIVPDLGNSLFVDLSKGAQAEARVHGLSLLIASSADSLAEQDRYLDLFDEARTQGMLLAPMHDSRSGIERVRSHGRPVVLVNYSDPLIECCTVLMDNVLDGYLAARHLLSTGVRELVFVAGPERLQPVRDRHLGATRAASEAGVELSLVRVDAVTAAEGRTVGSEHGAAWAAAAGRVGVIASTDLLALGILQSLLAMPGISIPSDVAVMGSDGNRSAWESSLPFSTVEPPGYRMGVEAVRLLVEEIAGGVHEHRTTVLSPSILERESTLGHR
jgi:LacI family transcriptional regulator